MQGNTESKKLLALKLKKKKERHNAERTSFNKANQVSRAQNLIKKKITWFSENNVQDLSISTSLKG